MSIGQQIINGTYGLDNRPPTAYEELKAWCEKYLNKDAYKVVPESENFNATIYFMHPLSEDFFAIIFENGEYCDTGIFDDAEMIEHIEDLGA